MAGEPMTPRAAIIAGFAAIFGLVIATDRFARRTGSGGPDPADGGCRPR
jgi:hypothetical protein